MGAFVVFILAGSASVEGGGTVVIFESGLTGRCAEGTPPGACDGTCRFTALSQTVTLTPVVDSTTCSQSGSNCPTSGCNGSTSVSGSGHVNYSFGTLQNRSVAICQIWTECDEEYEDCSIVASSCNTYGNLMGTGSLNPSALLATPSANHVYQYKIVADEVTGTGCNCGGFCSDQCAGNCPAQALAGSCPIDM